MTEPHFLNDLNLYIVSKEKSSIPDAGLVWSAFADYVQECRKQINFWQNQVKVLLKEKFTLQERLTDAEERLADANYEKECLTRSLAYANTEIRHLRCSPHPESLDGESYEDWENRR